MRRPSGIRLRYFAPCHTNYLKGRLEWLQQFPLLLASTRFPSNGICLASAGLFTSHHPASSIETGGKWRESGWKWPAATDTSAIGRCRLSGAANTRRMLPDTMAGVPCPKKGRFNGGSGSSIRRTTPAGNQSERSRCSICSATDPDTLSGSPGNNSFPASWRWRDDRASMLPSSTS